MIFGFCSSLFVIRFDCYSDAGNDRKVIRIDACKHVAGYVLDGVPPFVVCNEMIDCAEWSFLVRRAIARCFVKLVCN